MPDIDVPFNYAELYVGKHEHNPVGARVVEPLVLGVDRVPVERGCAGTGSWRAGNGRAAV